MSKVTYKVVRHDDGWRYETNGACSEQFPTREAARKAARSAATQHATTRQTAPRTYEDKVQQWFDDSG
jgi:hypothetical protein